MSHIEFWLWRGTFQDLRCDTNLIRNPTTQELLYLCMELDVNGRIIIIFGITLQNSKFTTYPVTIGDIAKRSGH